MTPGIILFNQGLQNQTLNALGQVFLSAGNGEDNLGVASLSNNLVQLAQHISQSSVITAANAQGSVYEQVGDVVVASQDTGQEAVESLVTNDVVVVDVNQTSFIIDVKGHNRAFFDADDVALADCDCVIYHGDQSFGLAGTFVTNDEFHHNTFSSLS